MTTIIIICVYILNIFLNRWIWFQIIKKDKSMYPNSPAVVACFLSLLGTIVLLIVWIGFMKFKRFNDFFTPKYLRK